MFLKNLHLVHFKNWPALDLEFSPKINCFVGQNGSGKTNLLDAIHYLSVTKSYFGSQDIHHIQDGREYFVVEGAVAGEDRDEKLYCGVKKGQKKIFKRNKKELERLADHVGQFPSVIISPYDRDLITEGSETRRRFMDGTISQGDQQYLFHLMRYNKALQQRNALLKYFAANRYFDEERLAIYDEQMAEHAGPIFSARQSLIAELQPNIDRYYHWLSGGKEEVAISYATQLAESAIKILLQNSREKDRVLQYTSSGLHKDNVEFTMNGKPIKKFGSQGQQKSFLIALKLAQYHFLKEVRKVRPILMLDDIFDKLDLLRVEQLIKMVNEENFGQIFITDTDPQRTERLVKDLNVEAKIFNTQDL